MNKILVVPDVHGRKFWKLPSYDEYDKIVFLGDYLDHYPGESDNDFDIENFEEIIQFKKDNPNKVVLLLGNHDWPYYNEDIYRAERYWCRHDYNNHDEIHKLFEDNHDLFQLYYIIEPENGRPILFTHAGFTNNYYNSMVNRYNITDIQGICDKLFEPVNHPGLVFWVGYTRGGEMPTGSIIWADIREHGEEKVKPLCDYFQVFGHTYCRSEIIREDIGIAMLDTGQYCFELSNETDIKRVQ